MNKVITNITIGNWYLVRGKPTKISPANVVWAFRDGCFPLPLTDDVLKKTRQINVNILFKILHLKNSFDKIIL